jgi:hypothetical protein
MTDFYTNNLILQSAEIREELYERLRIVRAIIDEPFPEWYNPQDFGSGYVKGSKATAKLEESFLANILDKLERS